MTAEQPKRRILIEGSKLADERMDGIKRYLTELLRAYRDLDRAGQFEIDVAILEQVYPLAKLPSRLLPGGVEPDGVEPGGVEPDADEAGETEDRRPKSSVRQRILHEVGVLIPPILLHPIRWIVPDRVALRVFGKPRAELTVPQIAGGWGLLALLVPPRVRQGIEILLPKGIALALLARGVLRARPRPVALAGYDLVHLPLPNNFHYLERSKVPLLVTVHDLCHLVCPEHQTRSNTVTLELGLGRSVESGASFLAVSEATREQMFEAYALDPSRIAVVHSGCSEELFHPVDDPAEHARVRRKYRIPERPFFLTLSTIEPRKNLLGTLRAFDLLMEGSGRNDVVLVIAGARGWKTREVLRHAGRNADRVRLTGYVDDGDLAALYSAARAFVFASHYEGFGLPALEAMRCGIPVVYGNNSALPEIVGSAGLPVDADDEKTIADQLARLLIDEELVRTLGERGLARAREFRWERTAEETLAVYERVLGAAAGEIP